MLRSKKIKHKVVFTEVNKIISWVLTEEPVSVAARNVKLWRSGLLLLKEIPGQLWNYFTMTTFCFLFLDLSILRVKPVRSLNVAVLHTDIFSWWENFLKLWQDSTFFFFLQECEKFSLNVAFANFWKKFLMDFMVPCVRFFLPWFAFSHICR